MNAEHKKYLRQQKAKEDRQQCIFTPQGTPRSKDETIISNPNKNTQKQFNFDAEKLLVCPFCLSTAKLKHFVIYNKKEIFNKHMAYCPNCKQNVLWKTLFNMLKWTPQQFADWVHPYALDGFWNKVYPSFKEWNKKLYTIGLSESFWTRYKELKGSYDEDSYNRINYNENSYEDGY